MNRTLAQAIRSKEKPYPMMDSEWGWRSKKKYKHELKNGRKFMFFTDGGWHEITIGHTWTLGTTGLSFVGGV